MKPIILAIILSLISILPGQAAKLPQPLRNVQVTDPFTGDVYWNFVNLEHIRRQLYDGTASIEVSAIDSGQYVSTDGFVRLKASTSAEVSTGYGQIYLDAVDGDLKIKFDNGVVKTIATN